MGAPSNVDVFFPGYADLTAGWAPQRRQRSSFHGPEPTKQRLYRLTVPDAILNLLSNGRVMVSAATLEQQFNEYVSP
jgi:hypothetical protein